MARRKNLPPLNANTYTGYMGFTDGIPHTWGSSDAYDYDAGVSEHWAAELFVTRADARRRFEDVREVRITVGPRREEVMAKTKCGTSTPYPYVGGWMNPSARKCARWNHDSTTHRSQVLEWEGNDPSTVRFRSCGRSVDDLHNHPEECTTAPKGGAR